MDLKDIRKLFDYTEWSNHLVLDAVESLPVDQQKYDFKISHGSIHGTLAHMAGAENIWLRRWRGESPATIWNGADFEDLTALRLKWSELEGDRRSLLDSLSEPQIHAVLAYQNLAGESYSLPLIAQMQHVINHATLHRGQVVGMIRQLGVRPPAVDLLYYLFS